MTHADRHARVSEVFLGACALTHEARADFLDQACADDAALRAEVEALLAHDAGTAIVDGSPFDAAPTAASDVLTSQPSGPPETIGTFEILGVLGSGGMGTVYRAQQANPERLVALKVIRSDCATPAMLRRFDLEARVLGRLQHPGIAAIFEAGTADTGHGPQPYFAMELIEGESLLTYAGQATRDLRERVELLVAICDAVHHAHLKGVIHRDLKPGNILVDRSGSPKVLDFGVARAIDSDLQTTMRTDVGQLVGTLAYMSPEQVVGDPDAIDVRSDVYALGVIGYELLADQLPYDVVGKTIGEAALVIRDEEPSRLGTISRVFRGDLDTIVAKALEKDKERRYASAAELAADLRRYLDDEPIIARPPTATYQLRKFARRHRALVAATVSIMVVLATAVVMLSLFAVRTDRARIVARDEADKAQAANDFLARMLSSANPFAGEDARGPSVTVVEMLDLAVEWVGESFEGQPAVEATVRSTMGRTYLGLAQYDESRTQFEAALALARAAPDDQRMLIARILAQLGDLTRMTDDYAGAIVLYDESLGLAQASVGPQHREIAGIIDAMSLAYRYRGDAETAERLSRESIAMIEHIAPNSESHGAYVSNLAGLHKDRGNLDEAVALYERAITILDDALGPRHLKSAVARNNLGTVLQARGDSAGAVRWQEEALRTLEAVLDDAHPYLAALYNNLATAQHDLGQSEASARTYATAIAIYAETRGTDHYDYGLALNNLAFVQWDLGEYQGAIDGWFAFARILRAREGERYWRAELCDVYAAEGLAQLGRYDEAERIMLRSLQHLREDQGDDATVTQSAVRAVLRVYTGWGKPDRVAEYEALLSN